MKTPRFLLWLAATCVLLLGLSARAEKLTIAAAADLKFAMDEIVTTFKASHPGTFQLTSPFPLRWPKQALRAGRLRPMPSDAWCCGAPAWMPPV